MKTLKKLLAIVNYIFILAIAIALMYGWANLYPGETSTVCIWFIGILSIIFLTFTELIPNLQRNK